VIVLRCVIVDDSRRFLDAASDLLVQISTFRRGHPRSAEPG
jgi:hypothetical protein